MTAPNYGRLIAGLMSVMMGVTYGYVGKEALIDGHNSSKNWKETIGTAIEPAGESYDERDPKRLAFPIIEFQAYQQEKDENGKDLNIRRDVINKNYSYSFFALNREDIKKLNLTTYIKPGMKVKLWYDPKDPTRNVVVPGIGWGALETTGFAVGAILSGSVLATSKEDLFTPQSLKKHKFKTGALFFSLFLLSSSLLVPMFLRNKVLEGTEEERRKRWVDPYVVKEK